MQEFTHSWPHQDIDLPNLSLNLNREYDICTFNRFELGVHKRLVQVEDQRLPAHIVLSRCSNQPLLLLNGALSMRLSLLLLLHLQLLKVSEFLHLHLLEVGFLVLWHLADNRGESLGTSTSVGALIGLGISFLLLVSCGCLLLALLMFVLCSQLNLRVGRVSWSRSLVLLLAPLSAVATATNCL